MNYKKIIPIIAVISLCFPLYFFYSQSTKIKNGNDSGERILAFNVDIAITKDGVLDVKEEIIVESTGHTIKHGIVRELPTTYTLAGGAVENLYVDIKTVAVNAQNVPYKQVMQKNNYALYIGDKNTELKPGVYKYVLCYAISNGIDFAHEAIDELLWNVTGNGWLLPIESVSASIHMPQHVGLNGVQVGAYTGYYGFTGSDFTYTTQKDGTIIFKTTRALSKQEGLTVRVCWPKGVVTKAAITWQRQVGDFLATYWLLLLCMIIFFVFVVCGFKQWRCATYRAQHPDVQYHCGWCHGYARNSWSGVRRYGSHSSGGSKRGGGFSGGGRGGGGGGGW